MIRARGAFALVASAVSLHAACSPQLSLEGRTCPCVAGYFCCESTGYCLPDDEDVATCEETRKKKDTTQTANDWTLVEEIARANVRCFATDPDAAYWMTAEGKIEAHRTAAGPAIVTERFSLPADPVTACGMARSGASLYVTLEGGSVLRLSVTKDADGTIRLGLRADRLGVGELMAPIALAAAGDVLYVADRDAKAIARLDGEVTTEIAKTDGAPKEVLVAGADLLWIDEAGLRRRPLEGGETQTMHGGGVAHLAVHEGTVFYVEAKHVWSQSLSGGDAKTLTVEPGATIFAIDGARIYFDEGEHMARMDLGGGYAEPAFLRRASEGAPLFFTVDATRFLWGTPKAIHMVRR
ncbi:MAG: hypothetical protein KIT84_06500 [Labilithrix sp.]|nr:hypothetical protein [Labilithrix sp.]MCW5810643.1 hypothetical protein [Labilithrix sp.]